MRVSIMKTKAITRDEGTAIERGEVGAGAGRGKETKIGIGTEIGTGNAVDLGTPNNYFLYIKPHKYFHLYRSHSNHRSRSNVQEGAF